MARDLVKHRDYSTYPVFFSRISSISSLFQILIYSLIINLPAHSMWYATAFNSRTNRLCCYVLQVWSIKQRANAVENTRNLKCLKWRRGKTLFSLSTLKNAVTLDSDAAHSKAMEFQWPFYVMRKLDIAGSFRGSLWDVLRVSTK